MKVEIRLELAILQFWFAKYMFIATCSPEFRKLQISLLFILIM